MAAGDKIPGGSTTNMASTTSTTLLLLHDGQFLHSEDGDGSLLSFLNLGTNYLDVMEISDGLFFFFSSHFLLGHSYNTYFGLHDSNINKHFFLLFSPLLRNKVITTFIITVSGVHKCMLFVKADLFSCVSLIF